MISSNVFLVPTSSISVDWDERRETEQAHINTLADSIARDDLLHTLTLEEGTEKLLAGGHRLKAFLQNAKNKVPCKNKEYSEWEYVPVRYASDFSPSDLARIELIENLQHRRLSWKEEAEGVAKIHALQQSTSETWTEELTAELLGSSRTIVNRSLTIQEALKDKASPVQGCDSISSAFNIVNRENQRKQDKLLEKALFGGAGGVVIDPTRILTGKGLIPPIAKVNPTTGMVDLMPPIEPEPSEPPENSSPILCASFNEWATTYSGPRFNALHLDLPYGLNICESAGQRGAKDVNSYDDSPEVYWELLQTLADNQDKLIASSAHMIFWFSQQLRRETEDFFTKNFPHFTVQKFLLIWHREDSSGLLPDYKRYGRRTYETAMFLTAGDRQISAPKNLSFAYPARNPDRVHKSEKPLPVVSHFLTMICDEHTRLLDPTCGSGTALMAASTLGVPDSQLVGLEIDPDMAETAQQTFSKRAEKLKAADAFLARQDIAGASA